MTNLENRRYAFLAGMLAVVACWGSKSAHRGTSSRLVAAHGRYPSADRGRRWGIVVVLAAISREGNRAGSRSHGLITACSRRSGPKLRAYPRFARAASRLKRPH